MEEVTIIPNAPNLVEATRSIGYSFETALADIVDNSIGNGGKEVNIKFGLSPSPYLAVIDDGVGMTQEKLIRAMRYGSKSSLKDRRKNDLGRFGLGLKMASLSQCRKLTVLSKRDSKISGVCLDLDYIHETQKWSLLILTEDALRKNPYFEELEGLSSGTVVLWENFDKISETLSDFGAEFNQKIEYSRLHLGLVFHRFIEARRKIDLSFNGLPVEAIDPFMTSYPATQQLEEETLFIEQQPIKVTPYIIPFLNKLSTEERNKQKVYKELNLNQGLYIYRNKRLIVWGKWFQLLSSSELGQLARVRIDLPNSLDDYWKIDVKKSSAQIPSVIKSQLKQIIVRSVGKSERVYKYRGRRVKTDELEHVWNKVEMRDKFQYSINRDLPLYKALSDSLDAEQFKLLDNFIKSVEGAFPYHSVYYDISKQEAFEEKSLSEEDAYNMAKTTIDNLSGTPEEQQAVIETLKSVDLFQNYPEIIKQIQEEYGNE